MAAVIITACVLGLMFLISWRLGLVAVAVCMALIAYVWIGNPELQAYKRDHPDWAQKHPNR